MSETPTGSSIQSEELLITASLAGDVDAFGRLFSRYREALLGRAIVLVRDPREAEDIVQETYLRAWAALPRFDRRRPAWPWLVTITHRLALDMLRHRSRSPFAEDTREHDEHQDEPALVAAKACDETFDEVCVRETRSLLARAIKDLPARQKRTLLLHELEGWSYADIAAAEAISVSSVKSLLFRARSSLREAYASSGALGIVLLPVAWLRRARSRARLEATLQLERFASLTAGQLASGIAALALAVSSLSPVVPAGGETAPAGSNSARAVAQQTTKVAAPSDPGGRREHRAPTFAAELIDPNARVSSPEDAQIRSFASSPSGRMVFAVGVTHCRAGLCPPVLFRSDDAGGSWTKLRAEGFRGDTVLLPPSFGVGDGRIFAMGTAGLQVSYDQGATFTSVVPLGGNMVLGSAAISPAFHRDDPRILIGGQTLMEYRDDLDVLGPALSTALPGPLEPAFAPEYPLDDRIVVGGREVDLSTGQLVPGVMVCEEAVCTRTALSGYPRPAKIRLAPDFRRSHRVIAFTDDDVFISYDGGLTFRSKRRASPGYDVKDARFIDGEIFVAEAPAAAVAPQPVLWVSDDFGRSWDPIRMSPISGGILALGSARGNLLTALQGGGLACSTDRGRTWFARC